jgi:hypothetical protein
VFLLARELHPHRRAHGTRQQRGVGRHVVGAVAAIAAGGLHADHVHGHVGHTHQAREVGAQHVRVLCAGVDTQRGRARLAQPVGHGTRGADGGVHLVRPHVGALHHLAGAGQGLADVALVHQLARTGRVVAQGLGQVAQRCHAGPRFPAHHQIGAGGLSLLLALGHDAHEVAYHHHRTDAGDVGDGTLVHRFEGVADEVAVVGPGVGRAHHAPVQHAGHAHVVHEHCVAKGLGRDVHTRLRLAHHAVIGHRFDGAVEVQAQLDAAAPQQLAVAHAARGVARHAHLAAIGGEAFHRHVQVTGGFGQQPGTRLGRRLAQRHGVDLDGRAGDGGALVGRAAGVAQHHVHLVHGEVEFVGHDLAERGADAGAQVHMAVQAQGGAVVPHREQHLHPFGRVAGHDGGLAGRRSGRRRRIACDQQNTGGRQEIAARAQLGEAFASVHASDGSDGDSATTARCTAARISMWVPQRHRLPLRASRTACGLGCGWWANRAAVVMIMPFRQ